MRLVEQVHAFVRTHLQAGDIAIDATAGNGHDTCFLAERVGPDGLVFAFDIQRAALNATRARLATRGMEGRARLILADHACLADHLPGPLHSRLGAVLFNLGYLPGGDHALTTRPHTTLAAIAAARAILPPRGVIAITGYRGHAGGEAECRAIDQALQGRARPLRRIETPNHGPIAWLIAPKASGSRRD